MGLIALIVISVSLNLIQLSGSSKGESVATDSTTVLKDSIAKQNDSIQALKKSLVDINEQANLISGNNLSPVDSIKKVINKKQK